MLEQPSSVPTSKEVAKSLEAARNNVSVLEAEAVRLDRLVVSQKRELISQEGAKRDIEDLIAVAEGKLAILDTQIESLEASKTAIEASIEAKKTELDERELAVSGRETEVAAKEAGLLSREVDLKKAEEDYSDKNEAFHLVRDHYFGKIDSIKQIVSTL